jgi:hypothetical protein
VVACAAGREREPTSRRTSRHRAAVRSAMRMMSSEPSHRYLVFAEECGVGISFITLDRMRWAIVSLKPAGRRTSEERCQERHSSTYLELNARA